jgi:hypothetical protein
LIARIREFRFFLEQEEERRNAIAIYQKEEEKRRELEKSVSNKEKRNQTIKAVQKNWLEQFAKSNDIGVVRSSKYD